MDNNDIVLTSADAEKVDRLIGKIEIEDSQAVLRYGVGMQSKIAQFSEIILEEIAGKDGDCVVESLQGLMESIGNIDIDELQAKERGLGKLFNSPIRRVNQFVNKYNQISIDIDGTIVSLEKARMLLLKEVGLLTRLKDQNREYMTDLECYIVAGERKSEQLKQTIHSLQQELNVFPSDEKAEKVNRLTHALHRFDQKLHDLRISKTIALQTVPQIQLIINNHEILIDKIQGSVLNAVPLWQTQMVTAISMVKQQIAMQANKATMKTTNKALKKNAEYIKEQSQKLVNESESGITEIEEVKKTSQELMQTIKQSLQIQQEAKQKRQNAEREIRQIENNIKQKINV